VRYCCKKKEETGIVGYCDLRTSSWTAWHDRDDPTVTGDWEVRDHYKPSGTCAGLKTPPTAIQGRLVKSKLPWTSSGEVLSVDPDDGLICENRLQVDKFCEDYEVRYCCKRQIKPVCPGQLVFQACGSSCPKKCFASEPRFCTMQCVPECQCPRGFYQTSDNRCVSRDQCYLVAKPFGQEEFGYTRYESGEAVMQSKPT